MSVQPHYDTPEGITENLGNLSELAGEREKAVLKRGERLNQFVILGRYFANACGSFGDMTCMATDEKGKRIRFIAKKEFPEIPDVLTTADFVKWIEAILKSQAEWKGLSNPRFCGYTYKLSGPSLFALPMFI